MPDAQTLTIAVNETQRVSGLLLALRSQGVTDAKVLGAIETTPRPLFTQDLFKERAFEDSALPIACGQTISQPFVVGLMSQALKIDPRLVGELDGALQQPRMQVEDVPGIRLASGRAPQQQ